MSDTDAGNSAKYETTHVSFFPVAVNGEIRQLFAICEGIPVEPVLKQVIALLAAAYLSNDYLSVSSPLSAFTFRAKDPHYLPLIALLLWGFGFSGVQALI